MQKEKIRNSILGILAFVLLFYEIIVLKGENYYLVSMAVLLIALFGFFAHFEKERPGVIGQGSWTPFQMVALGLVGFFAGVFFYGRESKRWLVALYGFFAVVIIYGAIVDLNTIFFTSQQLSLSVVCFVYLSGLPFNLLFGAATAGFLFCLYKPVLRRIERMVKKYRLFDKNEV